MKTMPTYTAKEIRQMISKMDVESCKILIDVINEEIDLYEEDEIMLLMDASVKIFIHATLLGAMKKL